MALRNLISKSLETIFLIITAQAIRDLDRNDQALIDRI